MNQVLNPKIINGIPEIHCHILFENLSTIVEKVKLIDVRRPDEFSAELGHIQGAEIVTLGPDLIQFLQSENKDQEVVFICRSGGRSGSATAESLKYGFKKTMNMTGGMLAWNALKLPTIK